MIKARKNRPSNQDHFRNFSGASAEQARKKAVLYARVSTKEQEQEGYSIDAQVKFLRDYAATNGYEIAEEFVEAESARKIGRTAFGKMLGWLEQAPPDDRVVLVERVDRLTRNHTDLATLRQLNPDVKFVRESMELNRESSSADNLVLNIMASMATHFSDKLSEDIRKGQREKARQGGWNGIAPLGYRNDSDSDGRRIVVVDPNIAPIIQKLFQWYATGDYSLKEVIKMTRKEGLVSKYGNYVPRATVRKILKNPFYKGLVPLDGEKSHRGKHEPLVSEELWEQVQSMLENRRVKKLRKMKRDFAFGRLISCAICGSSVGGSKIKGRYIYYRPSSCKKICGENHESCDRKLAREEDVEQQFLDHLDRVHFDSELMFWLQRMRLSRHSDEIRDHQAAIKRLKTKHTRLSNRIKNLRIDKYDGEISAEEYAEMKADWSAERDDCLRNMEQHQKEIQSYSREDRELRKIDRQLLSLFKNQTAENKRKILRTVFESRRWKERRLDCTFRPHFDVYARKGGDTNK